MLRRRSSSSSSAKVSSRRRSSGVGFDEFGFAFIKRRERRLQHRSHDYRSVFTSYTHINTCFIYPGLLELEVLALVAHIINIPVIPVVL